MVHAIERVSIDGNEYIIVCITEMLMGDIRYLQCAGRFRT